MKMLTTNVQKKRELSREALKCLAKFRKTAVVAHAGFAINREQKTFAPARVLRQLAALCLLALIPVAGPAQKSSAKAQKSHVVPASAATPAQSPQQLTQTEILPVFAIDMNFDPSWVDGAEAPTKSVLYNHNGVNDAFQKAWEALRPAGFRTIRFKLDLRDGQSAARLANLCIWAKANNVTLIPVLEYAPGDGALADFPAAFISRLRAGDGQQFATFNQVLYFQIESPMNVAAFHPEIKTGEAQKTLLSAIDSLRNGELQALQGSGVAATPIMMSASFDYELILQSAITGVALDPAAEQRAHAGLKSFLEPLAADANVDAVNVEWFPGSISSGDADGFAILLRELEAAIPGKQVLLTTGFSSAFNSYDQQNQFLTVATTKMWNFRLDDGGEGSHFLGVIFEQALTDPNSDAAPPEGNSDPSQWKWKEKAPQLARMLSGGKSSAALKWWLAKVRGNMALLAWQPDASGGTEFMPLPGLQAFQQISTALAPARQTAASSTTAPGVAGSGNETSAGVGDSQASQAAASNVSSASVGAPTYNQTTPSVPATEASGSASPSAYKQLMMTLAQQATTQLTTALVTRMTAGPASKTQTQYPVAATLDPGAADQTGFTTAGAQAQVPAFSAQSDAGPPQIPAAMTSSGVVSSTNAVGSAQANPPAQSSSNARVPTSAPAAMIQARAVASTSGNEATGTQSARDNSLMGTASTQLTAATAVRSGPAVSAMAGKASSQPTTVRSSGAPQPAANMPPSQSAAVALPSATPRPSPAVRSIPAPPSGSTSAIATAAQMSNTVATNQLVRPGPAPARSPSAPAVTPVPTAAPVTANQLVRPGPRSVGATARQANASTQVPASPNPATLPGSGRLDLSISAADIRVTPNGAGQVAVTALIHNAGNMGTGVATLTFRVVAAGRQVAASQPIGFSIAGNGVYQASWTTAVPPGQSMQLSVLVSAGGDANPANNQAVLAFTTPPAVASRR